MCGILGALLAPARPDPARIDLDAGLAALVHRGPDAGGTWQDPVAGVLLGHRRLAVVGLGSAGAQPMCSASGRYVLSYNGEIYNFRELAARLRARGVALRGDSDTEVLLETLALDGLDDTLAAADGMFALALWDRATATLTLARDRFGEKPLYHGVVAGDFVFASELKGILAATRRVPALDRDALASFLALGYVPEGQCIYHGLTKLPPGGAMTVSAAALPATPAARRWFDFAALQAAARGAPLAADPVAATDAVEDALGRAVAARMVADVPLGALLSGGIDSSLVVALMQRHSATPVRTFTIGFDVPGYDEAAHARAVARHLGTAHEEARVDAATALAVVPQLAAMYDEPFADSSQVPSLLVARLARRHVTTVLSGDGGDETFAGYLRYALVAGPWARLRALPAPLRAAFCGVLAAVPAARWDWLWAVLGPLLPRSLSLATPGARLHKLARVGGAADAAELYRRLVTVWDERALVAGARPPAVPVLAADTDPVAAMMATDTTGYLPGDILVKLDRAAMAASLETRVPFLAPEVVALAWRLPAGFRLHAGTTKWILRQVLARHLPAALFERPKAGFAVPLDAWLRGPLADWASDLLSGSVAGGFVAPAPITRLWREHRAATHNHGHALWNVLMFESWRRHWGVSGTGEP